MTLLRRNWVLVLGLVGLGIFAVFYSMSHPPVPAARKTIAVLLPSRDNQFWIEVAQGVDTEKARLSSRFNIQVVTSGDMDAADQVTQLRDAYVRGVAGVVIGIADSRAPAPAIGQFSAKNIPVVLIDTELDPATAAQNGAKPAAFIGSDNRQGGLIAAQAFIKAFAGAAGRKRVLLIKGSYVHQSAIDRAEGFLAGAKGHFEVIQRDGEWSRQKAQTETAGVVGRGKLDGIFASNDDMALGAIAALDNASLPVARRPLVVGFDATKDGRGAIDQGKMFASVGQDSKEMGRQGLVRLVKILDRQPVAANQRVPVTLIERPAN